MVLAIGTAAYDLFFPLSGWLEENHKYEIAASQESGGGPVANAACLLSLWGAPAALACLLGDDLYGRRVLEELRQAGTDLSPDGGPRRGLHPPVRDPGHAANGSRTLVNRLPPSEPLRFGPAALAALAGLAPDVLLFDGHQPEAALQAMAMFPRARTILDAGSRRRGTDLLAPRVEFLVPSERFARTTTGEEDLDSAEGGRRCLEALRRLNGREVVVTLGERGVLYLEGGELATPAGLPRARGGHHRRRGHLSWRLRLRGPAGLGPVPDGALRGHGRGPFGDPPGGAGFDTGPGRGPGGYFRQRSFCGLTSFTKMFW